MKLWWRIDRWTNEDNDDDDDSAKYANITITGAEESQEYKNIIELCLEAFWVVLYSKDISNNDECYLVNNKEDVAQLIDDIVTKKIRIRIRIITIEKMIILIWMMIAMMKMMNF